MLEGLAGNKLKTLALACVEAIRREKTRLSWDRFCGDLAAFAEQL